jgi:hypothetical protein
MRAALVVALLLAACGGGDPCQDGYEWAESLGQCVRCPPGFHWNDRAGKCQGGAVS